MGHVIDEPVFLLACGRSGSTLLQRILNTHEQLHIWGEHGGALSPIVNSFNTLVGKQVASLVQAVPSRCHAATLASEPVMEAANWSVQWYNSFTRDQVIDAYRNLVLDVFTNDVKPTIRHWGFKEIRYGLPVAQFLSTLFPKAKFILLVRDPHHVALSQLEYFYLQSGESSPVDDQKFDTFTRQSLDSISRIASLRHSDLAEQCRLVRYEDLLEDPQTDLSELAKFLDLPEFDHGKVDRILNETKKPKAAAGRRSQIEQDLAQRLQMRPDLNQLFGELRSAFGYGN